MGFVGLIPNILTAGTVLCGFMLMTPIPGVSAEHCVGICCLGLILDVMDGWLARKLNASSDIGAQFDQLADLSCFGIGPGLFYVRQRASKMSTENEVFYFEYMCGFLYVLAGVYRIARELLVHKGKKPTYFVGIPTNLAALLIVPLLGFAPGFPLLPYFSIFLSGLMVSTYRIPKGLWIVKID